MRILLDTHFVLAGVNRELGTRYPLLDKFLVDGDIDAFVSAASLWEIAIKSRLGKLQPRLPIEEIPEYLVLAGFDILSITVPHVITAADPEPETRDPFDRLLLAQCQVEELQLATIDRMLVGHPLALKL